MSAYDERPWLSLYAEGRPREIEPEHGSMLEAFGVTAARSPDKPAIVYFDTKKDAFGDRDIRTSRSS